MKNSYFYRGNFKMCHIFLNKIPRLILIRFLRIENFDQNWILLYIFPTKIYFYRRNVTAFEGIFSGKTPIFVGGILKCAISFLIKTIDWFSYVFWESKIFPIINELTSNLKWSDCSDIGNKMHLARAPP